MKPGKSLKKKSKNSNNHTVSYTIIIPARYASTRLPGKPLLEINGKPLLQHVYEASVKTSAKEVCIATDDERVANAVKKFGGNAIMTSDQHESGTDRLAEAVTKLELDSNEIVVNVQGDEFGLPARLIEQVASGLRDHAAASVATLCEPILTSEDYQNPNIVKVVRDQQGMALYFSRAAIPASRDQRLPSEVFRHLGLYAYRAGYLAEFSQLPACSLELSEALEQLRVLHHGEQIFVDIASESGGIGIDTEEDLELARSL